MNVVLSFVTICYCWVRWIEYVIARFVSFLRGETLDELRVTFSSALFFFVLFFLFFFCSSCAAIIYSTARRVLHMLSSVGQEDWLRRFGNGDRCVV